MNDSWIDKDELDDLVAGFSSGKRAGSNQQSSSSEDLFDDIPSIHIPRSGPHYQPPAGQGSPHVQPLAQQSHPVNAPLQVLVNRSAEPVGEPIPQQNIQSPFSIDEDDELDEIESQIEHLASETAKALKTLQEVRAKADQNGLIAATRVTVEPAIQVVEKVFELDEEEEDEIIEPLDRIPLDVQIDPHLSLKCRLRELGEILGKYVGMEEMIVVDRDGFSLFSTKESLTVEKSVGEFVKSIRKVYESESDARKHTASQLAVENGKWLCMVSTDGQIDGQFLMKALLDAPLDRPEVYVLVELLNEVLRPVSN